MLSVKSSGGRGAEAFYRYDNRMTITQAKDASGNYNLTLKLPTGVTWGDVEDFVCAIGYYSSSTYCPVVKLNETTVRRYIRMSQTVESYTDYTIDPNGNSVVFNGDDDQWNISTWSRLWLRKRI